MTMNEIGMMIVRITTFGAGFYLVAWTLISAIKTFVVPRGLNVRLTSWVFRGVSAVFRLRNRRANTYAERDRTMALFAPMTLILLPVVFLTLILLGYGMMFWSLEMMPVWEALRLSGSSLLTLGYASMDGWDYKILEFSEAMLGLILVALLIAYLPTMYAAFTRREVSVALLEGYGGSPPSAAELMSRMWRNHEIHQMRDFWKAWQVWFAEIEESHTSLAPLAFFRSPKAERSWVTAAGAVLDSAALTLSTVDVAWDASAALCIRNGYLALNQVALYFGLPFDENPQRGDPISISREEFDEVYLRWQAEGLPLVEIEQAWLDFAGWRVNYDTVLLRLAGMTMAPYAPWSSDRSLVRRGKKKARIE